MARQVSGPSSAAFTSTGNLTFVFRERISDLWRDFAVDFTSRVSALLEVVVLGVIAIVLPIWQMLLPGTGTVQLLAIALILSLFGLLRCHVWADQTILAMLNQGGGRLPREVPNDPRFFRLSRHWFMALVSRGLRGINAVAGADALTMLLALLPLHTFLSTGHFCEFSGVQWNAAFVGFDGSNNVLSGVLVALNTFGAHILCTLLAVLPSIIAFQSRVLEMDPAAADGHRCLDPVKSSGEELFDDRLTWSNTPRQNPTASSATTNPSTTGTTAGSNLVQELRLADLLAYATPGGNSVASRSLLRSAIATFSDTLNGFSDLVKAHLEGGRLNASAVDRMGVARPAWFDLGATPLQWQLAAMLHSSVTAPLLMLVGARGLSVLMASVNVIVQRRHLMIWAVFTPKWMFELCFWAVTLVTALLIGLVSDFVISCTLPMSLHVGPTALS